MSDDEVVFCPVTARQMDVLRLLADGLSAKEIARELGISHRTVQTHFHYLRLHLGGKNIVYSVAIAFRTGLIK